MPTRVLFVCLGNICRSPLAEAIFRDFVQSEGLQDQFVIDSAGTGDWHVGERADRRSRAIADKYGCPITHLARQVRSPDFRDFDHIIAMDHANVADLMRWPGSEPSKISLMLGWNAQETKQEVPDPYYGGEDGFEEMYRMLVPACQGLLMALSRPSPQTGR